MQKQQIRAILLSSKWDAAAETSRNINQAFGQGTVNERTAQHWFKKCRNGHQHCTLRFPHVHFVTFPCINKLYYSELSQQETKIV